MFIPLSVEGASNAEAAAVQYVGVDHGRGYVAVAEEFLDGSDVVAGLEQVGGEGVSERVARRGHADSGSSHGVLHGPLQDRFVQVVAARSSGVEIDVGA